MKLTQGMCRSSAKLRQLRLFTRADKIDTTGGGLFARLTARRARSASPARSLSRYAELRLDVRACVHRGECGLVDGKGGQP